MDFGGKFFQILPAADGVAGGLEVAVVVEEFGRFGDDGTEFGVGFVAQGGEGGKVVLSAGIVGGFAALQLLHQEVGRHGGVGFVKGVGAAEFQDVGGAGEGAAEGFAGFVDAGGHLCGDAELGVAGAGEAVGMGGGLEFAALGGEFRFVQRELLRQPEEREKIAGEKVGRRRGGHERSSGGGGREEAGARRGTGGSGRERAGVGGSVRW